MIYLQFVGRLGLSDLARRLWIYMLKQLSQSTLDTDLCILLLQSAVAGISRLTSRQYPTCMKNTSSILKREIGRYFDRIFSESDYSV